MFAVSLPQRWRTLAAKVTQRWHNVDASYIWRNIDATLMQHVKVVSKLNSSWPKFDAQFDAHLVQSLTQLWHSFDALFAATLTPCLTHSLFQLSRSFDAMFGALFVAALALIWHIVWCHLTLSCRTVCRKFDAHLMHTLTHCLMFVNLTHYLMLIWRTICCNFDANFTHRLA